MVRRTARVMRTAEVASLGAAIRFAVILVLVSVSARARDCSISKGFQLRRPQILAGVFEDPAGATLPGMELELLAEGKIVWHLRTNNDGMYDFGELPSGQYRLRVQYGGNAFCAPKVQCGADGCSINRRLTPNPKNMVTVY